MQAANPSFKPDFPHAENWSGQGAVNPRMSVGGYSRRGGDDLGVVVDKLAGPLLFLLVASSLEAASSLYICTYLPACSGMQGYAAALGLVSAIVVVCTVASVKFAADKVPEKTLYYVAAFLFLWWVAGVAATTFGEDALVTPIAYFSSWFALGVSGMILQAEHAQFKSLVDSVSHLDQGAQSTFFVLLASCVELAASIQPCANNPCGQFDAYAVALGAISLVACILLLRLPNPKIDRFIALGLAIWWTAGVGIVTLRGPFVSIGNGFFASLCAMIFSMLNTGARFQQGPPPQPTLATTTNAAGPAIPEV